MRANVEQEAVRTASAASASSRISWRRAPRSRHRHRRQPDGVGQRLIDQDVNIFTGPRCWRPASGTCSRRACCPFAHRPMSTSRCSCATKRPPSQRTDRRGAAVPGRRHSHDRAADRRDPHGAARLTRAGNEAQIDTLDRRVLLAALLFILAGAGIGYSMAERIADPVNRLTRATRRIAVASSTRVWWRPRLMSSAASSRTSTAWRTIWNGSGPSSNGRIVSRRGRDGRQVAHEIKNPLTPIQLNAEHLRRVNSDRGEPLSPC